MSLLAELQKSPPTGILRNATRRHRSRNSSGGDGDSGTGSMTKLANGSKDSPFGSSVNVVDTGSSLPANPVLPLFTQLNVRFPSLDPGNDQVAWKEVSR